MWSSVWNSLLSGHDPFPDIDVGIKHIYIYYKCLSQDCNFANNIQSIYELQVSKDILVIVKH